MLQTNIARIGECWITRTVDIPLPPLNQTGLTVYFSSAKRVCGVYSKCSNNGDMTTTSYSCPSQGPATSIDFQFYAWGCGNPQLQKPVEILQGDAYLVSRIPVNNPYPFLEGYVKQQPCVLYVTWA